MSIRIKRLKVKNWGPVDNFDHEFKDLVLIYGKNEKGKTTLIEALISSLFKDKKSFPIREEDFAGTAEVLVSELDGKEVVFRYRSKEKIDSYLKDEVRLLPLICVHASASTFPNKQFSKFSDLFDNFLFPSSQLAKLREGTPDYIKIKENTIAIERNTGLKKDIEELDSRLKAIDSVNAGLKNLSFYELVALKQKKADLNNRVTIIEKTKSIYKSKIQEEYGNKKGELKDLEDNIRDIQEKLSRYDEKKRLRDKFKREIGEFEVKYLDLDYLKEVKESLEKFLQVSQPSNSVFLWGGIAIFFAAIILTSLTSIGLGIILFVLGIISVTYFYRRIPGSVYQNVRLKKLEKTYKEKYGNDVSTIEELSAIIKSKEKDATICEKMRSDLAGFESELLNLGIEIDQTFGDFTEGNWIERLKKLINFRDKTIRTRVKELNEELVLLRDVDIELISKDTEGLIYDREEEGKVKLEMDEISKKIKELEGTLSNIKTSISSLLSIQEDKNILELVDLLQEHRGNLISQLRSKYFEALACGILNNVIANLENKRKSIVAEEINRPGLKNIVSAFTNRRYKSILLEEGEIIAQAQDDSYIPFSFLSSGTQEQISMAVRLGLTERVAKEKIFFILDDALLHTDWERRPEAVQTLINLAEEGWQLIYFTMDDHTRDVFKKQASSLNDRFQLIEM